MGVQRGKNYLNKHVADIHRIQAENQKRKLEACTISTLNHIPQQQQQLMSKLDKLKTSLFQEVPSRFRQVFEGSKENNEPSASSTERHAEFGRVPSYLIKMREEKEQRAEEEKERIRLSRIPPGCRYMSEEERLRAIEDVQANRREILDTLKKLPLAIETLGQRRRKIELELKLLETDKTLSKLNLKNVCIRD